MEGMSICFFFLWEGHGESGADGFGVGVVFMRLKGPRIGVTEVTGRRRGLWRFWGGFFFYSTKCRCRELQSEQLVRLAVAVVEGAKAHC